ncbi:MAG: ABC-2 family transporter protein [Bdellovibrionales bacterium]|nr:ABC-2 family transporter protein [Bdellovibrionales bacterium]
MLRYLRLYAAFVRFSFSKAMVFRLDFSFRIVMDLIYYAVNLAFYGVITSHSEQLAGWDSGQVRIFVSGYLLLDAIAMTLFSTNLWMFSKAVNTGELDYHLVRPVSSLFFLSLREFAANSFVNLLMAAGIMAWAIGSYSESFSAGRVILYLALILNGTLLYYVLQMLTAVPVFWTQSGMGLQGLFHQMARLMERPDGVFRGWSRKIVTIFVPFALMASFPARVLFSAEVDYGLLLHLAAVTAAFWGILLFVWARGLRAYSSASS